MPSEKGRRRRSRSRSRSKSPHRSSNRPRSRQSRRSPSNDDRRKRHRNDDRNRQHKDDDRRRRDRNDENDMRNVRVKREPVDDDDRPRRPENRNPNKDQQPSEEAGGRRPPKVEATEEEEPAKPKEKPNFTVSGKLAEDTNTYNGIVIKYNEPTEARKPRKRWRLYPFKGDKELPMLPIHRQSAYLLGRERKVADIPIDHPSCSKQHAVLQFRLMSYQREDGTQGKRIRPYLIDLDSSNGSYVNNQRIEPRRYVELLERDVMKFGYSSREYVLLHEESKGGEDSDASLGPEEEEGEGEGEENSQDAQKTGDEDEASAAEKA